MTTFAHLAHGSLEVLDPRVYDTVEEYKTSFAGAAETTFGDHTFKQVTDGTLHGARDNEDGTYTNPAVVEPIPVPQALTKTQFVAHLAASRGDLQTALDDWPTA